MYLACSMMAFAAFLQVKLLYTVSKKHIHANCFPYLRYILTDSQNFFTVAFSSKICNKAVIKDRIKRYVNTISKLYGCVLTHKAGLERYNLKFLFSEKPNNVRYRLRNWPYSAPFLPRDAMGCAVLVIVILSVCPSVCYTRGLCPHGWTYDHDFFTI